MLPPNPADKLRDAPTADLVTVLLRQFKRLLDERDVVLTKAQIDAYGERVAAADPLPEGSETVIAQLRQLVAASHAELDERFEMTFAQSLAASMDDIGGWETTADFLEIANHKSNAELRISAGSALLVFLGAGDAAPALLMVIDHDAGANDVDAIFAKRALSHYADVSLDADNWRTQIEAALAEE